jgi:hypothetical protein
MRKVEVCYRYLESIHALLYHRIIIKPTTAESRTMMEFCINCSSQTGIDAVFAADLNSMTVYDRQRAFYDLHGVADAIEEDPELVAQSLRELDDEIGKIRSRYTYNIAETQSHEYVHNPDFRLMFLRASSFNANGAAGRLVKFFEVKNDIFGKDKLTKDIKLEDLDEEDDRVALESGVIQILPLKDRSGRVIVCILPMLIGTSSLRSWVSSPRYHCPRRLRHLSHNN